MAKSGARIAGGSSKGRILSVPADVRPTTAMTRRVFADTYISELHGIRFLDLYAGSGILTCELLSRGAERSVAVERSKNVVRILRRNLNQLGYSERVEILPMPVKRALRVLSDRNDVFDLIYADPPYSDGTSLTVDSGRISAVLKVKGLFVFEQSDQTTPSTVDGFTVEWSKRIGDTRLIAYRYMG